MLTTLATQQDMFKYWGPFKIDILAQQDTSASFTGIEEAFVDGIFELSIEKCFCEDFVAYHVVNIALILSIITEQVDFV